MVLEFSTAVVTICTDLKWMLEDRSFSTLLVAKSLSTVKPDRIHSFTRWLDMKKKITPLIVENDPMIVAQIEDFLSKTQLFEQPFVSGTCTGAMTHLHNQTIDLLFLDIEMPDMNGLDFLRLFPTHCPTVVMSAHPKYAIDCFDCDVRDFLPKPLNYIRFLRSIRRSVLQVDIPEQEAVEPWSVGVNTQEMAILAVTGTDTNQAAPALTGHYPTHIYLKTGHINQRFTLSEIMYLEASNIYTKIVTPEGATVVSEQISNLEERLGADRFVRVHKSYIVNIDRVTRYSAKSMWLKNHVVPIGRVYQANVKNRLQKAGRREE